MYVAKRGGTVDGHTIMAITQLTTRVLNDLSQAPNVTVVTATTMLLLAGPLTPQVEHVPPGLMAKSASSQGSGSTGGSFGIR